MKYMIDQDLPAHVKRVGDYLVTRLEGLKREFDFITGVRGRGLLIALDFNQEIAEKLVLACIDKRLLVNKLKPNALRFMPPLIITEKEVDEAVGIVRQVLAETRSPK